MMNVQAGRYGQASWKAVTLMQQNQPNGEESREQDNPALIKVCERNTRTIIHLRTKAAHQHVLQNRIADAMTSFSGRMVFAYVHIAWFGLRYST